MSPSQRATLGEELPIPTSRPLSEKPSPWPFASIPPIPSCASLPSTSRQRRRRSFSSISIERNPHNLCQHWQDTIRALLIDTARCLYGGVSTRSTLGRCANPQMLHL